ncbi:hypothetical protein V6N13_068615 [Hibiscus sabdariffa]
MDPFKQFVGPEECSSSESGWTSYLASPMEEDYGCSEENYNSNHNIRDDVYDGEGNSDDSMVSDASSAPSHHHQHNKHKDGQGSHGKYNSTSKHSSRREAKKETKKSSENGGKSKKGLGGQAKSRNTEMILFCNVFMIPKTNVISMISMQKQDYKIVSIQRVLLMEPKHRLSAPVIGSVTGS